MMKYLKKFENIKNIFVGVYNYDEMYARIYTSVEDYDKFNDFANQLEKRIRYFTFKDFNPIERKEIRPFYFVLYDNEYIIGISKIGNYDKNPNLYSISYLSIDKNYRGQKLSKLIIDTILSFSKEKKLTLTTSDWSLLGKLSMKKYIKSKTKEMGIEYIENDNDHDGKWMYNDNLIHVDDMTDKERDDFYKNENVNNKPISYGGIVIKDNKILLREPTNHFDDYVWTFAKGKPNYDGEDGREVAKREVLEETGMICKIIKLINKPFSSGHSDTYFYIMELIKDTGKYDWETNDIKWVNYSNAIKLISKTTNIKGRMRDLKIIKYLKDNNYLK